MVTAPGLYGTLRQPVRSNLRLWMMVANTWQLHATGDLRVFVFETYMVASLRGYELRYFPIYRGTTHDYIELLFLRKTVAIGGDGVRSYLMRSENNPLIGNPKEEHCEPERGTSEEAIG